MHRPGWAPRGAGVWTARLCADATIKEFDGRNRVSDVRSVARLSLNHTYCHCLCACFPRFLLRIPTLRSVAAEERVGQRPFRESFHQHKPAPGSFYRPLRMVLDTHFRSRRCWMVDGCAEFDLGRLEGILYGEIDVEQERASCIRTLCWASELGGPLVDIVLLGSTVMPSTGSLVRSPSSLAIRFAEDILTYALE